MIDPRGRIWIQTDVSGNALNTGAYAGFGNIQMLGDGPAGGRPRSACLVITKNNGGPIGS